MALLQIIYTSQATAPMNQDALRGMVAGASKRNRRLGVTGMLHCSDQAYLQVLEGEEQDVLTLYADILRDGRHDNVHTVAVRPIDARDFGGWSMGLLDSIMEPIDLENVLSRGGRRLGVWNDADWRTIVNTFRAELETVEP